MFWIAVAVVAMIALAALAATGLGRIAISGLIAAGACLLIYAITDWAIAVTLAKICGVGVILIAAFSIIHTLFDKF